MNESVLDRLMRNPSLPSSPRVAGKVLELCHQSNATLQDLVRVIGADPAMTAKTLRTVNQPPYGCGGIGSLAQAAEILGIDAIKTLALSFCLVPEVHDRCGDPIDLENIWRHAFLAGAAAREIAQEIRHAQAQESYVAGMAHALGILAMMRGLGEPYVQAMKSAGSSRRALAKVEMGLFEVDHIQVAAAILDQWGVAGEVVGGLRNWMQPDKAPPSGRLFARIIAGGMQAAEVLMLPRPDVENVALASSLLSGLGIPARRTAALLRATQQQASELAKFTDQATTGERGLEKMLARAGAMLAEHSMRQEQKAQELARQNARLEEETHTDPLTRLGNRRRFAQVLERLFTRSQGTRGSLSLLFADIDHFKRINDEHGHLTGDHVLVEVAKTLRRLLPMEAVVARYGGDEFVVLLPEFDRQQTAGFAEGIRQGVAALAMKSEMDKAVPVTMSVGAATQESGCFATSVQLQEAADRALYSAKDAGRNCVRIYRTATSPPMLLAS